MTLDILQKPVHNVHFELKSQSKCRFITVLDGKWNLDTCEDTTQQGILRWGMLLTTWLLSDPCPMIQSTQSSFITLDNFYPTSLTLYIPYQAIVIFFTQGYSPLKALAVIKKETLSSSWRIPNMSHEYSMSCSSCDATMKRPLLSCIWEIPTEMKNGWKGLRAINLIVVFI